MSTFKQYATHGYVWLLTSFDNCPNTSQISPEQHYGTTYAKQQNRESSC